MKKKNNKIEESEVIFEEIPEEKSSFKNKNTKENKKLEKCLEERQEYLDG
jgi:hypothetical protein